MASINCTTVDRLKAKGLTGLDLNDSAYDDWLEGAIAEVSGAVESFIGHKLKSDTVTEVHDVDGFRLVFWLRRPPVASIASVQNRSGVSVDWASSTTIDSGTYDFDATTGRLVLDAAHLSEGPLALRVIYSGGFAATTSALVSAYPDIASAAERQIAYLWRRRNEPGQSSSTVNGMDRQFQSEVKLLKSVEETLRAYRRYVFV